MFFNIYFIRVLLFWFCCKNQECEARVNDGVRLEIFSRRVTNMPKNVDAVLNKFKGNLQTNETISHLKIDFSKFGSKLYVDLFFVL